MQDEIKKLDRDDLIDEILSILFNYLITENKKKDQFIQTIWKEKTRGDKNDEFEEKTIRKLIIENMFLQERIDKAIEYIEKFIPIDNDTILMRERQRDCLLDILKGSDKEC